MARWFRSELMEYVSVIVNEDAAHDCLSELGTLGVIQFTDLNPQLTPFQRRYVSYVKRCDDMERRLRYFRSEIDRFGLEVTSANDLEDFLRAAGAQEDGNEVSGAPLLEALESETHEYEEQLRELSAYAEKLTTEYNAKVELQEVLERTRQFFVADHPAMRRERARYGEEEDEEEEDPGSSLSLLDDEGNANTDDMRFSSITGVVEVVERARFERTIFRATRGNCYVRFAPVRQPLTDPVTGALVEKCVFIIFYKSLHIENKIKKICDAFSAHRYSLPDMDDVDGVTRAARDNAKELRDGRVVLLKNQETRFRLCEMLSGRTELWTWIVLREKAVYHSLNTFEPVGTGMLRGEGWVVKDRLPAFRDSIERAHADLDFKMPSLVDVIRENRGTPPTHFHTDKFTYAYQEFVNTYGIPRYREANPALFTAATFPFMFGVMYGDIGHGFFLFLAGLYMCFRTPSARPSETDAALHSGRYMLASMGFFAVYAGAIYNDCFSLGLNLFGSRYSYKGEDNLSVTTGTVPTLAYPAGDPRNVYPFGLDPAWHVSTNELLFFNSFKMKLSVVLGITQMLIGTLLKGANALHFKERLDLLYEVIPMLAFSLSLFVYMVFLIFLKWCINWDERMLSSTCIDTKSTAWGDTSIITDWDLSCNDAGYGCTPWGHTCDPKDTLADRCPLDYGGSGDGCAPPNLITVLINIALAPGSVDQPLYANQGFVQSVLLLIAVASVPVLLLAKPLSLSSQQQQHSYERGNDEEGHGHGGGHGGDDHGDESFGELMIHQGIETIEFVLGMVSNTASYLRLWALSLAHSELATVFWSKAMLSTLGQGWLFTYVGFGIFAGATFGVLLLMDVLECFLHALRLHWVEFQNKFFKADGVRFAPFCFRQVILDATQVVG